MLSTEQEFKSSIKIIYLRVLIWLVSSLETLSIKLRIRVYQHDNFDLSEHLSNRRQAGQKTVKGVYKVVETDRRTSERRKMVLLLGARISTTWRTPFSLINKLLRSLSRSGEKVVRNNERQRIGVLANREYLPRGARLGVHGQISGKIRSKKGPETLSKCRSFLGCSW